MQVTSRLNTQRCFARNGEQLAKDMIAVRIGPDMRMAVVVRYSSQSSMQRSDTNSRSIAGAEP
jgi:hypothetical protein